MSADIMRRKLQIPIGEESGVGGEQAWRLSWAKAMRDVMQMPVDFLDYQSVTSSLTELLDQLPERPLLMMLEGPQEGLGLIAFSPNAMATMIEQMTMGRCAHHPPEPRKPSRTDCAILSPLVDMALMHLETSLVAHKDVIWAGGFRHVSFVEDARSLHLLLEDVAYRSIKARVSFANTSREGEIYLALPAQGRGLFGQNGSAGKQALGEGAFTAAFAERVGMAQCQLEAVLTRVVLPLSALIALSPGQILPLPEASLTNISVEGIDAGRLVTAHLGQHGGMRAIRLSLAKSQVTEIAPQPAEIPLQAQMPVATEEYAKVEASVSADISQWEADPFFPEGEDAYPMEIATG